MNREQVRTSCALTISRFPPVSPFNSIVNKVVPDTAPNRKTKISS